MNTSSVSATVVRSAAHRQNWRQHLDPFRMVKNLWAQRALVYQLTKREILLRYRGSVLGIFWSFLNPLISLFIYTTVFGFIFNSKFGEGSGSKVDFALGVFCGLLLFNLVAESITASPRLILQNPNYVTKVVFPLEILPLVTTLNALAHLMVALIPLWLGILIFHHGLPWTTLYMPLILLPLLLFVLGITWFFASLGVFLRDINGIVVPLVQVLLYGSAIFYSITKVPDALRWLIQINPVAQIITEGRSVMLFGLPMDWPVIGILMVASFIVCMVGYAFFMGTKHAFPDVL